MDLDDVQEVARLDAHSMRERISELPQQCKAAWEQGRALDLPKGYAAFDHVMVVGMGGSAIGGALLQDLVSAECSVPISLIRGYELPRFLDGPRNLVIACSYSGNTEETLACFREAVQRGARSLVITTGGQLAREALDAGVPVIRFDYESQPRAALGYSFVLLLAAVHRLGLVRDYSDDLVDAVQAMETWQREIRPQIPRDHNEAKQLAERIEGRLPVVYGAASLAAVANRWKTQLNENAKSWAFFELLPELNHNAVVGLTIPEVARENALVICLRSPLEPSRIRQRWEVTGELLERQGVAAAAVWGRGESRLGQILSTIHFGDYVSFYLAMLHGVDPTPVDTISFLKQRLADLGGPAR